MKRTVSSLSVLFLAGTILCSAVSVGAAANHSMHQEAESTVAAQRRPLEAIYERDLQVLSHAVNNAIKLLQDGDSKAAMAELQRIKAATDGIRKALAAHVKISFVNDRCPIMNSPIKAERVKEDLVREFQGQKVAFCCAGCPSAWDRLSDTEKQQKLSKVLAGSHSAH